MIQKHSSELIKKIQQASEDAIKLPQNSTIKMRTWKNDSNRERSIIHQIQLNSNQLQADIEDIVKVMRVGDIWEIKIWNILSEEYDYLVVQIQSIIKEVGIKDKTVDQQFLAESKKKQGNTFIKQKKYQEAIKLYQSAFQLVQLDCREVSVQLKLSIMSNLALATLNSGKFRQCIEWCNKHRRQSVEDNIKITYRKASAEKCLKNWQSAKDISKQAVQKWKEIPETANDFKNLLLSIEKAQKEELNKQKKIYSNMFS